MIHKRQRILGGLMAVWLAGNAAHAADLPPVARVVSFGDSLSDCGTFGFKPTTAPSPAWNQLVAAHFHDDLKPNLIGRMAGVSAADLPSSAPGGLCYAQGGARTATGAPGKPEQFPISGVVQLDHFLAQHGHFDGDQLITVYLGTNDVLIKFFEVNARLAKGDSAALADGQATEVQAAKDVGALVQRMIDHGAKRIAVLNLYDLGNSDFIGAGPALSGLTDTFNAALQTALPHDPAVIPIDTHAFFAGLEPHPEAHGYKHPMNEDACIAPTKLGADCYAGPANWKSPDAGQTYMLIGMVHFTGRTEELVSDYVIGRIEGHK